jgi:16S rRNA (uracil1498-N3)-methyltransferase
MTNTDVIENSSLPRLFVDAALVPDAVVTLGPEQTHYLLRVMRCAVGSSVRVFNGRDGLWLAEIDGHDRRRAGLRMRQQLQRQMRVDGPWLAFGVPKRPALELILQKGTELGVTKFIPVATQRSFSERLNPERMERIAIEAAEQCERLDVPEVTPSWRLADFLKEWPAERALLWCDESGLGIPIADALDGLFDEDDDTAPPRSWGLMIGPEGGFASAELDGIAELPFVTRVALGPRILRAETAAIAALAIGQAIAGDGDIQVRGQG